MHRTIAILVLIGGGLSQAAALTCPMDLAPATRAPATLAPAGPTVAAESPATGTSDPTHGGAAHHDAHHGAHQGGHPGTPADDAAESPHHGEAGCQLVLACVAGVLPAPHGALIPAPPPVASPAIATAVGSRASTLLSQDPPPPRLPV